MALNLASPYAYWPLDDTSGATPALQTNITDFPDLTFPNDTGLWADPGWCTADGLKGAKTGDDAVVKATIDLSTLGDGMLIFAAWHDSPDFETAGDSDRVLYTCGTVAQDESGMRCRRLAEVIPGWSTPSQPASKYQTHVSSEEAPSESSAVKDIMGEIDQEGPFFVMTVLRNVSDFIEVSQLVDGFQTDVTLQTNYPVWDTTQTALANGITLMQRLYAGGGSDGFLPDGDRMRDFIVVRCETDQYMHVHKLASDAYKQDGGIPDSWSNYL